MQAARVTLPKGAGGLVNFTSKPDGLRSSRYISKGVWCFTRLNQVLEDRILSLRECSGGSASFHHAFIHLLAFVHHHLPVLHHHLPIFHHYIVLRPFP